MVAPSNAVLARYLAGECSPDEVDAILRWAAEEPARSAALNDLVALWQARAPSPSWDVSGMWRTVQQSMRVERGVSFGEVLLRQPRRRSWRVAIAAVAAVALVAAGIQMFRSDLPGHQKAAITVSGHDYTTGRGQRATLQLPDGSRLILAPASRLRIPTDFGRTAREVWLEGEALFDVVHDTTRPFRVMAKYALAQDIGTRFGVRAYPEDTVVTVAVAEGAVALGAASAPSSRTAQGIVLGKDEMGTLGATGRVTTARGRVVVEYLAWVDGRLVLPDVSLGEAAARLSRWYGVDIRLVPSSISTRRVTAAFAGESPGEALQFIASFLDLTVIQAGDRYTLQTK